MEVLDARAQHSRQELNDLLLRALVGTKRWEEFPEALQIMTCIDRMDKKVPGGRANYDILSEIAHPNWLGVFGMYSKRDEAQFITYFGRGLRGTKSKKAMILNAVLGSLSV
jgi:hypothetical protein